MTVELTERRLGDLRWIVLRGPAAGAFGRLGAHMRTEIRGVLAGWPGMARLRRHVAAGPGSAMLAAVRRASRAAFPDVWAELAALADGAGVPLDDLALLNFRGDLGVTGPGAMAADGGGCSDVGWRRRRSFIAHNEDESGFFDGRCAMLTLALDELPAVTAFWKAGLLPSSTITIAGTGPAGPGGLVWSIDHLTARSPGPGAGRHFVARGLQRTASTLAGAIEYLHAHPSAGGFAYTIGDRTGRVVCAESSAGQFALREAGEGGPLLWHTNHGRYVGGAGADAGGTSLQRGEVLAALEIPGTEPGPAWFLRVLAGAPPGGVRAGPAQAPPGGAPAGPDGDDQAATLCTFVIDLTGGEVTVLSRGGETVTISLAGLAGGGGAGG